jgi:lipopolysaccharide export system ATP-binding protein
MGEIVAKDLHKFYGKRHIIKGIDFNFKTGEVVGILGPNGAGKTTSFYMIVGIAVPNGGTVFIDGKNITKSAMYERGSLGIGYLPQEPSIFRGLSVEDNILAVLEFNTPNKAERMAKLESLMEELHISRLAKQKSVSLSGGERRRLEIARLLALNPQFIFLDEPFAGVDPVSVEEINQIINNLKNKGIGVIITDHNVRETLKITDRTYIIYDGKVLVEGNQEQILSHEDTRKHYLGSSF